MPQIIFTIIGTDYEGGKEIFSFTLLVNMLHILQIKIFIISANFVVFHKIEKEKKMQHNAAYLSEKMRFYSMKKTTKMTNFIPVLRYANSFVLHLQDCTEGEVLICYNHNINLQMTKRWVRDAEASFHNVLIIYIGDPSLITMPALSPCQYALLSSTERKNKQTKTKPKTKLNIPKWENLVL